MQRIVTTIATLALIACNFEEENSPPPIGSDTGNQEEGGEEEEGGDDSTGEGPMCEVTYAEYACRGFMGCLYRSPSGSTYKLIDEAGLEGYRCFDYEVFGVHDGDDDLTVSTCEMYFGPDYDFTQTTDDALEAIALACRQDCEDDHSTWINSLPATYTDASNVLWTRDACGCEVELLPDGKTRFYSAGVPLDSTVADCSFLHESPEAQQIDYMGECEDDPADDDCPLATCTGFRPAFWTATASSCTGSGGNACATIDTDFWLDLFADPYDLVECDAGRLVQHDSATGGPAEWWDFQALAANDFFYEIGLRTNDKLVRVKIGATWYPLTTSAQMMSAYDALGAATVFTLEVLRGSALKQFYVKIQQCPVGGC